MTLQLDGVAVGRWSDAALVRRLVAARGARHSYDHVGSTLEPGTVPGVPEHRSAVEVEGSVAAAAAVLRRWGAHDGIRARLQPPGAPIEAATTVLVVAPFGPFEMAVPNRIVAVVDEPERYGFAYGTLQGHAEVGEELFLAEATGPGRVRLSVRIHAQPGSRLARLGRPVVLLLQRAATRRYLDAWAAAVRAADDDHDDVDHDHEEEP